MDIKRKLRDHQYVIVTVIFFYSLIFKLTRLFFSVHYVIPYLSFFNQYVCLSLLYVPSLLAIFIIFNQILNGTAYVIYPIAQ